MLAVLTPILMLISLPISFAMGDRLEYPKNSDFVGMAHLVMWLVAWPLGVMLGALMSFQVESTVLAVLGYLAGMSLLIGGCLWGTYRYYSVTPPSTSPATRT